MHAFIAWLDFSENDCRRMIEVISLFGLENWTTPHDPERHQRQSICPDMIIHNCGAILQ